MADDNKVRLGVMKELAAHKVAAADGDPKFIQDISDRIDFIAGTKLVGMQPANENLIGFSLMLLAEIRRLKGS